MFVVPAERVGRRKWPRNEGSVCARGKSVKARRKARKNTPIPGRMVLILKSWSLVGKAQGKEARRLRIVPSQMPFDIM